MALLAKTSEKKLVIEDKSASIRSLKRQSNLLKPGVLNIVTNLSCLQTKRSPTEAAEP